MRDLTLFAHLLAVVLWIGGMAFAHYCLRPALAALEPAQRLPLLAAVLGRFFSLVGYAVVIILGTGFALLAHAGFAAAPLHWHAMAGSGLAMTFIFLVIRTRYYPLLLAANAEADWPAGGNAMAMIRQLVGFNLGLGIFTVALATLGRQFA